MTPPTLVFGWGNPSRGDDALGPAFVERVRALALPGVEVLEDFQLQPEHALDLVGRRRVLFVDASAAAPAPFGAGPIVAARDASFTTHAMSPQALLQVFQEVQGARPPPCVLLAIRGERFGLGEALSAAGARHLDAALQWARRWLSAVPAHGASAA
jgi:hydrogenase maturation protease